MAPAKKPVAKKATTKSADKIKKTGIDAVIANIEKSLGKTGKNIIVRYGDVKENDELISGVISFGDDEVDRASNCGGVPLGKMVEIYGPESSGKSLLSLKLIASAQADGYTCCLVDAEQSFDPRWAARHGVDTDNLFLVRELMNAEETLDVVSTMCSTKNGFDLVVVDSTAALIPKKELEGTIADQDYALLARALSKACKQIVQGCGVTKTTCVFLNQIREKMNVMFGSPETTPGGRALKFYSHQRISVYPAKNMKIKDEVTDMPIGRRSKVTFVKNKTAIPWGECVFTIIFDQKAENPVFKLTNLARSLKLITIRDKTFKIHKDVLGQKKNEEPHCMYIPDVAHWLVQNNMVEKLLEAVIDKADEEEVKVESSVSDMAVDQTLIVTPLNEEEVKDWAVMYAEAIAEDEEDAENVEEALTDDEQTEDKESTE